MLACEELTERHHCELILLESGGDNLAADFSRELADFTIYVIDVAGGIVNIRVRYYITTSFSLPLSPSHFVFLSFSLLLSFPLVLKPYI
jgi:hypothetical protein